MICEIQKIEEKTYRYVVVLSFYRNHILLSRHEKRTTWETQGGHIEPGETPLEAAKRELYEESGALEYEITPLCAYWAEDEEDGTSADGVAYVARIQTLGPLPESEMAEVREFETLPENITYPGITPVLFAEYQRKNTALYEPWLSWAMEIQSIAQCGLAYVRDVYDRERYERLRELSAEMLSYKAEIPKEKVKTLFCNETGYQTPKMDSRAAIFSDDKILLVHEKNGTWSMPGGWVDVMESVKSNTVKEVWEEAGLQVEAERIIAVQDRNKHNIPPYAYGICKVFVLCRVLGGSFVENIETTGYDYFSLDNLPNLAEEKCTREQIEMCFQAYHDENWKVQFD